ncbi:MAG TPA: signal peptidase I [Arthrobacter bacterium]|jgi:signal peptidase|nr:signal peptidase I [Arthrobacter sp.]HBH58963.1 signal peptidase I [Arthrobacter sp.]HCB57600.1 signal peptidase I [Arthrobacter sp.]
MSILDTLPARRGPVLAAPADRATAEQTPVPTRRILRRVAATGARALTTALVIITAAVFLFLAVGPRFLGYQTSTMLTGSMSPLINPGDVVVSIKTPTAQVKAGDIITYSIPVDDHRIETHRVTEVITNTDGTIAVRTKGDANTGADPWTATLQDDYVHTTAVVIPHLGDAIRALSEPTVRTALLYGAPALLVIALLTSIWRKTPGPAAAPAARNRGRDDQG